MISKNKLNLLSLISIQASNAVLPLILFPYLLFVSGADLYSKIAIAEIVSIVALAIVIFGFEINGVKKIVDVLGDNELCSTIFSEIFFSRLFLFIIALALLPIVYFIYGFDIFVLTSFWMLIPLSYIVQNSYFFLAVQSNAFLALFNILSRLLTLAMVYGFVKTASDGFYAPAIIGICYLLGAIVTFIYLIKKFKIKLKLINLSECKECLSDSFQIFLSNASVLLYRDLNVVFLSLVVRDPTVISSYSLAEKFVKSFQAVFRPISQYFFPQVVVALQAFNTPDKKAFSVILSSVYIQLGIFTAMLISLILFALFFSQYFECVSNLISSYKTTVQIFILMAFSIFFGIPNFMLGSIGLNILRRKEYLTIVVFAVGVFNVIICMLLSTYFGAWGAAISFSLAELVLVLLVCLPYVRNHK